mgnify:CR=1 FL=1
MEEIKFLDKYFNDLKVLLSNQNYFQDLIKIKQILIETLLVGVREMEQH